MDSPDCLPTRCRYCSNLFVIFIHRILTANALNHVLLTFIYLLLLVFHHPSLFHSRLKTFLFCKSFPSQHSLSSPGLTIYIYMDSPDCLPTRLSISVFYFVVFFVLHFSVVGSVQQIKLTHVGFRAHVKIASRIVSWSCSATSICLRATSDHGAWTKTLTSDDVTRLS